jgi:protein-tyrosine phosphatase
VQRERVSVWVGKAKIPTLSQKTRQGWGNRKQASLKKTPHGSGMDITWLTDRIAVGGGIWNAENMAQVAAAGITHIIDMQVEFDDTLLAEKCGIAVLWNPTDDDFEFKPAELFESGVEFARVAMEAEGKVLIHCAAGVHRGPMMTAALLGTMGWELTDALDLIEARRPAADFPEVYVRSVEGFLLGREKD